MTAPSTETPKTPKERKKRRGKRRPASESPPDEKSRGRSGKKERSGKAKKVKTTVLPLLTRPGARYTCFGDGLCCTDIHGLGPITKSELVQVRKLDPRGAGWDDDFEDRMLKTRPDGGCHFLMPDLRCGIHAEYGPEAKPEGCRQFPLGLVATPDGGRITTRHRCPCRTIGERPPVDAAAATPSISDAKGTLSPDLKVKKVRIRKKKKLSWSQWRLLEDEMLGDLAAGVRPEDVLGAMPFPRLKKSSWTAESDAFVEAIDGTRFGFAIAWFGETLRSLVIEGYEPRFPTRTWADAFDRAEARPGEPRTEDEVLADWVADEIWALEWNAERGWEVARAELATRLAIARDVARRLQSDHDSRPGRAAAEALMIVELVGESDFWSEVVERIRV